MLSRLNFKVDVELRIAIEKKYLNVFEASSYSKVIPQCVSEVTGGGDVSIMQQRTLSSDPEVICAVTPRESNSKTHACRSRTIADCTTCPGVRSGPNAAKSNFKSKRHTIAY